MGFEREGMGWGQFTSEGEERLLWGPYIWTKALEMHWSDAEQGEECSSQREQQLWVGKSLVFWRTESSGEGVGMTLCVCVFVNVACESMYIQVHREGMVGSGEGEGVR